MSSIAVAVRVQHDALAHDRQAPEQRAGELDEQVVRQVLAIGQDRDGFSNDADLAPRGLSFLGHARQTFAAAPRFPW